MKLHVRIPKGLKAHFDKEIEYSQEKFSEGDLHASWHHLERAHILGQAWPVQHTEAHLKMLGFAIRIKNTKEIIGQLPRLLVGGIKSFVGEIPLGNPGGANVPPLKPFPISEDLASIINQYKS